MYENGNVAMQQDKQSRYQDGAILGGVRHAEPPRRPEVAEMVDKLEKSVAYAEESLNELVSRLGGVLRPAMPEPTSVGNQLAAVGPSTGYGTQLHEQHMRAARIAERMQDVLRRLEV